MLPATYYLPCFHFVVLIIVIVITAVIWRASFLRCMILFAREAWLSAESCFNGHRSHSRRPLRTRNTSYFPHCPPRALAGNGGDKHEQRQRHEQHEAEVGA